MTYSYRLLLDEHIELSARDRLRNEGHDVDHVDFVPSLGKGVGDEAIAQYSLEAERAIVTHDSDFIEQLPETAYHAVLLFEDESLSARELTVILNNMATVYPFDELRGLQKTGREWL